jgi:uncharacterized protein with von Willebrand factor type A (vWA) domain
MSDAAQLPRPLRPFAEFARRLRAFGFAVAPEQVTTFLAAVRALGPRGMEDIRQAALATLSPPPDRRGEFEALFRQVFYGETVTFSGADEDEDIRIQDGGEIEQEQIEIVRQEEGGALSSALEQLSSRTFDGPGAEEVLRHFSRALPDAVPVRRSFRSVRTVSRGRIDIRRSLGAIVKADGDVPNPQLRRRKSVQRRLLLLIDVSGSMKAHTEDYLKVAHAVVQGGQSVEVFTFGTRLTRITRALRIRNRAQALDRAAHLVGDWDGGTRIGTALAAFLSVPRYATYARGAAIVALTDGLERGDPAEMIKAVRRLSAMAFRLSLATPLAGDPRFRPETAALKAILPDLDDLVDGASIASLTRFILSLGRPAPAAETVWRQAHATHS